MNPRLVFPLSSSGGEGRGEEAVFSIRSFVHWQAQNSKQQRHATNELALSPPNFLATFVGNSLLRLITSPALAKEDDLNLRAPAVILRP